MDKVQADRMRRCVALNRAIYQTNANDFAYLARLCSERRLLLDAMTQAERDEAAQVMTVTPLEPNL